MTNRKNRLDARLGRRVRTRLTRVLVMAVAGPVMAGSLAYAAGVEPVRRRVDEFLKGTAGLFKTAESSTRDFHLSPNPSGQGVLVMPLGDSGPRPAADHSTQGSGNEKEGSAPSGKSKEKSEPDGRDLKNAADSSVADSEESKTKSDDSKATSSGSDAEGGSGDGSEESHAQEADDSGYDGWQEGSGDSEDDRSGSNSGSDDSDEDRSGSDSGDSDSKSDKD